MGSVETVPFFGLKTNQLKDVFAPSCMSCFDYVNSLADLVVGYMGAPFGWQWIMVRNDRGQEMLDLGARPAGNAAGDVKGRSLLSRATKHPRLRQRRHPADVGSPANGCGD